MATSAQTPEVSVNAPDTNQEQQQTEEQKSMIPVTHKFVTYGRIRIKSGEEDVIDPETEEPTGEKQPTYDYKWVNDSVAIQVERDKTFEVKGKKKEADLEFKQPFKFPEANTQEGVIQLFTTKDGVFNLKEYLNQVNNAITVKLGNKTRSLGMDKENDEFTFEPSGEAVDMTEYVAEAGRERRTAFQKLYDDTEAQVSNFSPEMKAMLRKLLDSGGVTQ